MADLISFANASYLIDVMDENDFTVFQIATGA